MITDCNLYSRTHVLGRGEERKKNIFINGYQLKHAQHVSYWTHYLHLTHKCDLLILYFYFGPPPKNTLNTIMLTQ